MMLSFLLESAFYIGLHPLLSSRHTLEEHEIKDSCQQVPRRSAIHSSAFYWLENKRLKNRYPILEPYNYYTVFGSDK
jgi:hypothetical protein